MAERSNVVVDFRVRESVAERKDFGAVRRCHQSLRGENVRFIPRAWNLCLVGRGAAGPRRTVKSGGISGGNKPECGEWLGDI